MNKPKFPLLTIPLLLLSFALLACGLGDVTPLLGRSAKPKVSISTPPSGSEFHPGEEVVVQSTSTDLIGVVRVELSVDGEVVRTDQSKAAQGQASLAVSQTWMASAGKHVVSVRAFNVLGVSSDPIGISVSVSAASTPTAPIARATSSPDITVSPTLPSSSCTDNAAFVADITVPDGTVLAAGQTFNKIWRVRNTGCSWDAGYQLVFVSGEAMTTTRMINVRNTAVGETADLLVPMTAPSAPGLHTGAWRLRNASGVFFGTGVTVKISVLGAQPSPQPTAATACSGTPVISSLIVTPNQITAGGSATLSWGAVTNADSVEIDGIGGVATPGALTVKPNSTTTFLMTAHCGGTTVTAQATLVVPFAVLGAMTAGSPTTFSGACPKTISFSASITVNGPGDVVYKWERSDSSWTQSPITIHFNDAGSQIVMDSWTLGSSGKTYSDYKQHLHILSPTDVTTNDVAFTLSCP